MKFSLFFFGILLFLSAHLLAQKAGIENVEIQQVGNKIWANYDLFDPSGRSYLVNLYVSTDGGSNFSDPLLAVSNDVGYGVSPGEGKRIIWDVLEDRNDLKGDEIVFQVEAYPILDSKIGGKLRYDVIECKGAGSSVTVTVLITNLDQRPLLAMPCGGIFNYYATMPYITATGNRQMEASYVEIDNQEISQKGIGRVIPQGMSSKLIIRVDNLPNEVTKIISIELKSGSKEEGEKPVKLENIIIKR